MHMNWPRPTITLEILRTTIAIADTGSFSKAAKRLGISQPAVSSQVKRLQQIIGDEIFERGHAGSVPTNLGKAFLVLARKTLETHDQIMRLGVATANAYKTRIGLSPFWVKQFLAEQTSADELKSLYIQTDRFEILGRALIDERLDIACDFCVGEVPDELQRLVVAEREGPLVWVRSSSFVVSPGQPIPIVARRNEDWLTTALVQHGLSFQVVFDGEDFEARRNAVEAGQGLIVFPNCVVPPSLVRAREYYLPALPKVKVLLLARQSNQSKKMSSLIAQLKDMFFDNFKTTMSHGSGNLSITH